jgi:FkbM family methyltransferase
MNITDLSPEQELDEIEEKKKIREFFNNQSQGVCVEVGANESTSLCSQSFHLEKKLDWFCILIEPIPILAQEAIRLRPKALVFEMACTSPKKIGSMFLNIPLDKDNKEISGHASLEKNADEHNYKQHKSLKVKTNTLTNILKSKNFENIDFLSIDVEGVELDVLLGIDFNLYRPKLILLEDKHLYLKKHLLLKAKGYKLVQRLNRNCWYIPKELNSPQVLFTNKLKLFKRMYLSIWYKKIHYSLKHKSLTPFKTL